MTRSVIMTVVATTSATPLELELDPTHMLAVEGGAAKVVILKTHPHPLGRIDISCEGRRDSMRVSEFECTEGRHPVVTE